MKKILLSVASAGAVAALAFVATGAFFSDEEKSVGNTFQAGAIDLTVDYSGYYNKAADGTPNAGSWTLKDLSTERFFALADVKPGDYGEGTISLHITSNPSYACVNIIPTMNDDVTTNEPELAAGDTPNTDSIFDGELAQSMHFKIWADDGDNVLEGDERVLTEGTGPITPTTWALANPQGNVFTGTTGPLLPNHPYYLGVAWDIPTTVGNKVQTDKYMADISFYVEQSRNNPNFVCPVIAPPVNTKTLRLENERIVEGGPWEVIADGIHADLTWTDGPTFGYTLVGQGLAVDTNYSLIYYADGWPGNNPGAFIGTAKTNGSGAITMSGSPNLSMDLPMPADGNYAVGAKIWLVLSSDYDGINKMTAWNPASYLFEGNVYIHYDDTDITP